MILKSIYFHKFSSKDPPSVYDLVATSLNETAIDLAWSVPAPNMGSFNSLEVKCFLNDDFTGVTTQNTLNKTIDDRTVDKLTVTNLIPGALYNCFVTTLRSVQGLATRKDSSIAACMTSKQLNIQACHLNRAIIKKP